MFNIPDKPPVNPDCDHRGYVVPLNAELLEARMPGLRLEGRVVGDNKKTVACTVQVGCSNCAMWWQPKWKSPQEMDLKPVAN